MPKFRVFCIWHVAHTFEVDADTLEEAKEKLLNAEPPYDILPKGDFVDDSFEVVGEE